jgi:hypothetical protein
MLANIYIVALGLIVCAFVEIGIFTFLKEPENLWVNACPPGETEEEKAEFARRQEIAQQNSNHRMTTVSVLSLLFSTALLAIALLSSAKLSVLNNGILLGGVFTLLCGVGIGIYSGRKSIRFLVATFSLVVALTLGYLKFVGASG